MKILFFLTPKADVAWISSTATVRQALEKLERSHYSAVPILNPHGHYDGALTDADLLWYMKGHPEIGFKDTGRIPLSEVPRRLAIRPIDIEAEIEELFHLALDQNFVPVIDDRQVFIGIVRRRSILTFFAEKTAWAVKTP